MEQEHPSLRAQPLNELGDEGELVALFHHGELVADVFAVRVWRVFGPEALLGAQYLAEKPTQNSVRVRALV